MQGLIKTLLFFALLSLSIPGKAQVKVSGRVTDTDGNPVNGAFVIASHPKDSSAIVAYTFTEVDGRFILPFSKAYDSVLLVVKCLGYHDIKTLYDFSRTTDLVFSLAKKEMHIKEVVIKSQPIKQQGDTVKYLVSSFAKGKDFSIGDVIKNMPGFQVESDGTILHEGKPISKYYINGLDLLEGGYTVVNKNLPHQAVGSVEVLKKHQPIKILQGVIPTNATALNLKLKNNITITGSSQLGGGYKPYLYDVNLTPMLFQNNQQLVFSLQANNVGQELESQFNIIDVSEGIVSGLDFLKPRYVMVSRVPSPSIAMDRYYDNNSQYASLKYLIKMNDRWETKVDANYYSDLSYRKGIVNRTYFFTDSSINFLETTTNELKNSSFRLGTRLSHNSRNIYLNSKTNFTRYWNNDYATIGGTNSIMQNAGYPS